VTFVRLLESAEQYMQAALQLLELLIIMVRFCIMAYEIDYNSMSIISVRGENAL
jgi:hypothetical protein